MSTRPYGTGCGSIPCQNPSQVPGETSTENAQQDILGLRKSLEGGDSEPGVPVPGLAELRALAKPRNCRQRTAQGAARSNNGRPAWRESSYRGRAVISEADSTQNGNPLGNPDRCLREQREGGDAIERGIISVIRSQRLAHPPEVEAVAAAVEKLADVVDAPICQMKVPRGLPSAGSVDEPTPGQRRRTDRPSMVEQWSSLTSFRVPRYAPQWRWRMPFRSAATRPLVVLGMVLRRRAAGTLALALLLVLDVLPRPVPASAGGPSPRGGRAGAPSGMVTGVGAVSTRKSVAPERSLAAGPAVGATSSGVRQPCDPKGAGGFASFRGFGLTRFDGPGFLVVDALPLEAQVFLDARPLGSAAQLVARAFPVAAGRHAVAIVAPDFKPYIAMFLAGPGFPIRLRVALSPE